MTDTAVSPPRGKKLSALERQRLEVCERTIERTLGSFLEAGTALAEIKESRLYRSTHATFHDYVRERWGMGKSHAYRLITAATVAEDLSPIGDNTLPDKVASTMVDVPANEAQARAIAKVPADKRPAVLQAASDATDGKVTAAAIKRAAAEIVPAEKNGTPSDVPPEFADYDPEDDAPDPIEEWNRAQAEVDRLTAILETLQGEGDLQAEVVRLTKMYGQLDGRLQHEMRTSAEAQKQATYQGKLLREVRELLKVEKNSEIVPCIRDLLK